MSDENAREVFSISDGDVKLWIEQEAIHLKSCDPHGDPVELTADHARRLARILESLAQRIEV